MMIHTLNRAILLFCLMCTLTVFIKEVSGLQCGVPHNLARRLQELRTDDVYSENIYMLPPLKRMILDHWANRSRAFLETSGEDPTNGRHIFGNTECSLNKTARYTMARSLCPWSYVYYYDKNRYPSTMIQASCNCVECIGKGVGYGCQPIYYTVRVLRILSEECGEDGLYQYVPDWEKIAVGCTCVADKISKHKATVMG